MSTFPFSSPSPPQTPLTRLTSTFDALESPHSPQTEALIIKTNPFNHVRLETQYSVGANPFVVSSTPQHASPVHPSQAPQSTDLFDDPPSLPKSLPKAHSGKKSTSIDLFTPTVRSLTNANPFSDAHSITSPLPLLPIQDNLYKGKTSSEAKSTSSTVNYTTARTEEAARGEVHSIDTTRPSLSKHNPNTRAPRSTNSAYSLDREVRLREAAKQQDRRLALERAKDEVRRLSSSTSTVLPTGTPLPASFKNSVPSLLKNGFFWAALILTQAAMVSTGAAAAVLVKNQSIGDNVGVGTGTVFWLVCSIAGLIIGGVCLIMICFHKGNAFIGTQEKLGLNEIRSRGRYGDLETSAGGRLLYLGVGERDESSSLGDVDHGTGSLRRGNGTNRDWAFERSSIEASIKDPIWKDLYITPSNSNNSLKGSAVSARTRNRDDVASRHPQDPDLGAQRLKPTATLVELMEDEERMKRSGNGSEHPSIPPSLKSKQSENSTLTDWTGVIGTEVHGWSPLERLERVLSGQEAKIGGLKDFLKEIPNRDEGVELIDLTIPDDRKGGVKGESTVGKGIKWVGEQVAEYGMWSPEIVQQRMQKRKEEKAREKERLKQPQVSGPFAQLEI